MLHRAANRRTRRQTLLFLRPRPILIVMISMVLVSSFIGFFLPESHARGMQLAQGGCITTNSFAPSTTVNESTSPLAHSIPTRNPVIPSGLISVLLPAYWGSDQTNWNHLIQDHPPGTIVIVNAGNGPGSNDPILKAEIEQAREVGIKAIGYVNTRTSQNGFQPANTISRSINDIEHDIDAWYNSYPLDGIQLANAQLNQANLSFYKTLHDYIKAKTGPNVISHLVYINGGGIPSSEAYMQVADIFKIYENTLDGYKNSSTLWMQKYPSSHFAATVSNVPAAQIPSVIRTSLEANIGYVYILDQGLAYNQLPAIWDQEVATLASYDNTGNIPNTPATPKPVATPIPTATPVPASTPTPTLTPTATPTPTPVATPTATPVATSTAAPAPAPTPVATPTATPVATSTAAPAPAPTPVATTPPAPTPTPITIPAPVPTPVATSTAAPAPTPTPVATTPPNPVPASTPTIVPVPSPVSTPSPLTISVLLPAFWGTNQANWDHLILVHAPGTIAIIDQGNNLTSYNPTLKTQIDQAHRAGIKILGYVNTGYFSQGYHVNRDINAVEQEITNWYTYYPLDGIELDSALYSLQNLQFYQTLHDYIKNEAAPNTVNRIVYLNGTGVSPTQAYMNVADIIQIYDGTMDNYSNAVPSWMQQYAPSRFAITLHNVSAAQVSQVIQTSSSHVGYIYMTDQNQAYNQLPSIWDQEVAALNTTYCAGQSPTVTTAP